MEANHWRIVGRWISTGEEHLICLGRSICQAVCQARQIIKEDWDGFDVDDNEGFYLESWTGRNWMRIRSISMRGAKLSLAHKRNRLRKAQLLSEQSVLETV